MWDAPPGPSPAAFQQARSPQLLASLEWVRLVLFVALRLVGSTVATGVFLWRDHADPMFDSAAWMVCKYAVLLVYTGLHISWGAGLARSIRLQMLAFRA